MEEDALSFLNGVSAFDFRDRLLAWTRPKSLQELHVLSATQGPVIDMSAASVHSVSGHDTPGGGSEAPLVLGDKLDDEGFPIDEALSDGPCTDRGVDAVNSPRSPPATSPRDGDVDPPPADDAAPPAPLLPPPEVPPSPSQSGQPVVFGSS